MNIKLITMGGTDKTIRFEMVINDISCGELQMERDVFTKIADKLFDNKFVVSK